MISTIIILCVVSMNNGNSDQQTVVLPSKVIDALRSNAKHLSGLHIRGQYQNNILGNPQETLKQLGTLESEAEFTQKVSFDLRLDRDRIHEEIRYPPGEYHSPDSVEHNSYDSEKYYSGSVHPTGANSGGLLMIHTHKTLKEKEFSGKLFKLWYLQTAGFEGSQNASELGEPLRSLVLYRISQGTLLSAGVGQFNGREVFELTIRYPDPWMSTSHSNIENDPKFTSLIDAKSINLQKQIERDRRTLARDNRICRFVLDLTMNYAVINIRESREKSGELLFNTSNSDFRDLGNGLWLPLKCEVASYAYYTRPTFSSKTPAYVTKIMIEITDRMDFSDKDFQVWFDLPGVNVDDYTHEKASYRKPFSYRVPGSIEKFKRSNGYLRTILIGLNVFILVVLLVFFVWRRKFHQA